MRGGAIRHGALIRADAVERLTTDGWAALWDHGVRTVIDVRSDDERTADAVTRPAGIDTVVLLHDGLDEDPAYWKREVARTSRSTNWLTISGDRPTFNHMVEQAPVTDDVFHALASGARREMVGRLATTSELTVTELAAPLEMSLAAASKHVKVLERAGLIRRTVQGRRHVCRLDPAPLAGAAEWLRFYERHWDERLDALAALFGDEQKTTNNEEHQR